MKWVDVLALALELELELDVNDNEEDEGKGRLIGPTLGTSGMRGSSLSVKDSEECWISVLTGVLIEPSA